LFSILVVFLTIPFFVLLYRSELTIPDEHLIEVLDSFDVWNVVQSKKLFFISLIAVISLLILFLIVPADLLSPDMIAITIAMILIIITHFQDVDENKILKTIDYQLILYLLGIFIIAGGLEVTGVIDSIDSFLKSLGGGFSPLIQIISIMWIGAILSSIIDNIPITKVLIPIVEDFIPETVDVQTSNRYFYGLSIGANWGDNITPLGDNILVVNISEQNRRPIRIFDFWRLGLVTTIYQLCLATLFFVILFELRAGIILIGAMSIIFFSIWILSYRIELIADLISKLKILIVG
jgi:Na+/H+ antiporter NhaD/arsenite permease-like protein